MWDCQERKERQDLDLRLRKWVEGRPWLRTVGSEQESQPDQVTQDHLAGYSAAGLRQGGSAGWGSGARPGQGRWHDPAVVQ